jgi:hypothetical protein
MSALTEANIAEQPALFDCVIADGQPVILEIVMTEAKIAEKRAKCNHTG